MKDDNVKKQNRKMKMSRTDICVTVLLTAAGLLLVILAGILLPGTFKYVRMSYRLSPSIFR